MKRFFYHYLCLIYSFIQSFMFIAMLVAVIKEIKLGAFYGGYGDMIIIIIASVILLFLMAIGDKFLRGVDNSSFWIDCLLLMLISPLRFIFQIITTIRVHYAYSYGNDGFGKRGNKEYHFKNYIYYYLFNSEHIDPKNGQSRKIETKRGKKKREEKQRVFDEIMNKYNGEADAARKFLKASRRGDRKYNVFIVPLCSIDADGFSTLAVQNNSYTGERYIDQLFIDDKKIIFDTRYPYSLALSLVPGYYDFKIHIAGNVKSVSSFDQNQEVDETFTLKKVYVGEDNVYLCASLIFGTVVTRYTERYTGKIIKDEFHHFEKRRNFAQVSLEALNTVCDYWSASVFKIDDIDTPFSR